MLIVQGRVDLGGCLMSADPPLARLQLEAGGRSGEVLAIPQLALIARHARRSEEAISRPVILADGPHVRRLLVEASPDSAGVTLTMRGWEDVLPLPEILDLPDSAFDFARLESDGAWQTDAQLRMTKMAAGVEKDIGFLPATARGSPFARIFRLLPDATGDIPVLAALANGTAFDSQPAELLAANARPILLTGAPQFDAEGEFEGLTGSFRFLTLERAKPAPVDSSASELDRIMSERLEPALRAPIGRIIEHADATALLTEGPLRQNYARYAEDIAGAARHLLALVDDLANLQAIEQPDFRIETEAVDLADIVRRATALLAVRMSEKKILLNCPAENAAVMALGDYGRVLQIIVNLLGNAVRYSPIGGGITVTLSREAERVALTVSDEGIGIASTDHERIFGKFQRLNPAELGGSGLGLYISRQLARAMGGDLTVQSTYGAGAQFTLGLSATADA